MAALICKGFSDLCNGACRVIGVPFRLLCNNPFAIYVVATLGFNIPATATGLPHITDGLNGCKIYLWLLVNTIFCFTNIAGAFYIAYKFQNSNNPETARLSGIKRATYILCHDPGVAIYILFLIGFFVWLCIGITWRSADDNCGEDLGSALSVIGLGFSFLGVGFMAIMISLCCSCCKGGYGQDNNVYHIPAQNNDSAHQPAASQSYQNNDVESTIPTATPVAEAIPASVVQPSAPPLPTAGTNGDKETKAAATGISLGGKIGSIFGASDKTKAKLETGGAKTSIALHNAFEGVKKMAAKK
eukprot:254273_1